MIEKGANDFNAGLLEACKCGNIEIVELLIKMGASDIIGGFRMAGNFNKSEVVKMFLEKKLIDINEILCFLACKKF